MPIAKISGPGLAAIAASVAALWGCLAAERIIVSQANREIHRTLWDSRYRPAKSSPRTPAPNVPAAAGIHRFPLG